MKKIFISMLLLVFLLTGCTKVKEEVKIITPAGAPLLSHINLIEENDNIDGHKINLNVVSGVDAIKAAFTSKSHDIIVSPINLGIQLNNKLENFDYQILNVVSNGNIYLASTSKLETFNDLSNKKIVLFGKGTINDYIVNDILNHYQINSNVSYLGNTQLTNQQLIADKENDTVYLVAEPALTASTLKLKSQNKEVYRLDITKEIKNITNLDFYQAAVFAKKSLDKNVKDKYLELLENSIDKLNTNTEEFAKLAQKYKEYGVPNENVLKLGTKGMNLEYIRDIKVNLNNLIAKYPKAFGNCGDLKDEFFY